MPMSKVHRTLSPASLRYPVQVSHRLPVAPSPTTPRHGVESPFIPITRYSHTSIRIPTYVHSVKHLHR